MANAQPDGVVIYVQGAGRHREAPHVRGSERYGRRIKIANRKAGFILFSLWVGRSFPLSARALAKYGPPAWGVEGGRVGLDRWLAQRLSSSDVGGQAGSFVLALFDLLGG